MVLDPLIRETAIPAPVASFDGIDYDGWVSPDPNGAAGPSHYVQMVNVQYAVFGKNGDLLVGPAANNSLWSGFGGACEIGVGVEPIVLYDRFADRWLLTQEATDQSSPFETYLCIALSTSVDPTGTYYRWAFSIGQVSPEYPNYAIWSDAYYVSTREFVHPTGFRGVGAYALNRMQMIAGNPSPQVVSFLAQPGATPYRVGDGLLPADVDGSRLPPDGTPEFYIGTQDNGGPYGAPFDALNVWIYHVDFVTPAASTFILANTIAVSAFDSILSTCTNTYECIPQPDTTRKLSFSGELQRPAYRAAYRNFGTHESIVTNQSVEASGIAGIRWWEIRSPNSNPVIYQEGTYAPGTTDGIYRWMASIAQDHVGNIAMGYSASDGIGTYPSVRYTGRLVTDPLGVMPQGEGSFVAGGGSQTGATAWGNYTSMSADPADDCTLWYTSEYYATSSPWSWKTRIGSVKFPACEARRPPADRDGDFSTDRTVFRPGDGLWLSALSRGGATATVWGMSTDHDVLADYDGDGKGDVAVWRPALGTWFIVPSASGTVQVTTWGIGGDIPLAGDVDGDGKNDLVIYRPSSGAWFFNKSGGGTSVLGWGIDTDIPLLGDFDGDGARDPAIFRPNTGAWYVALSGGGSMIVGWGTTGDIPVIGDFDGDGKSDVTVFRPASGQWFVKKSSGGTLAISWGTPGDVPVSGDWDGDGKSDFTVWRPSSGIWYTQFASGGITAVGWGVTGDRPSGRLPGS